MENIKHIHEVLFLFQEIGKFESEKALIALIHERFGNDVQFVSCSNQPFGVDGVVEFLLGRQKIVENANGSLELHPDMTMCDGHTHHGEEGHHH